MGTTTWSALAAGVIAATPLAAMPAGAPVPPPALPDPAPIPGQPRSRPLPPWSEGSPGALQSGGVLLINGQSQQARWLWLGGGDGTMPSQLWLPLEVLQGQLGVSVRNRTDGTLELEWFGAGLRVPPGAQRSLEDEVAVEVSGLLRANGVTARRLGERLELTMPLGRVRQLREAGLAGGRRLVLDLDGPALVRDDDGALLLGLEAIDAATEARLGALGLRSRRSAAGLQLSGVRPARVFSLGEPPRLVIDLPGAGPTASGPGESGGSGGSAAPGMDPRLQALLGRELLWERRVQDVAGARVLVTSVRLDPRTAPLDLRTLSRRQSMEGLSSLPGLARGSGALVAVNGGYFNRVRRLPLGALRDQGRWLSGPILGRGAIGWEPRQIPRFGRLRLDEWVSDSTGRRVPLVALNSGWVQRGISRYTADWGPGYRPISGNESALLLRNGVVQWRVGPTGLGAGVALAPGDDLLVARGGAALPWGPGEQLRIESVANDPLGRASNVIGGGPLLLQDGRVVLDGTAEGFGAAFLRQGAPRTVVGSDGQRLWLITLEGGGGEDPGPTLAESAWLLQRMGLRDALNLDGGSSTGLVMGGVHSVRGRGVGGAVHHGLGLVPADNTRSAGDGGA
ncbi:MAG: phosphodiester glycosidase family protein [Cyanobacteriota bacterium]|nr:phosphodiester glycosidase family protein [Cyanobacteriota bacterium]